MNKKQFLLCKKLFGRIKQHQLLHEVTDVTDDGLYDRKAFYTVEIVFNSSSMNDGEFINYWYNFSLDNEFCQKDNTAQPVFKRNAGL